MDAVVEAISNAFFNEILKQNDCPPFPYSDGPWKMFTTLNSGANLVELLNSRAKFRWASRMGESNWWNGQIGSDSVKADITSQYNKKPYPYLRAFKPFKFP